MSNLKVFMVGEYDYVAATDRDQALKIMREVCGEGSFDDDEDVCECIGSILSKQWTDEDSGAEVGCLNDFLAEAEEPGYLVGLEG